MRILGDVPESENARTINLRSLIATRGQVSRSGINRASKYSWIGRVSQLHFSALGALASSGSIADLTESLTTHRTGTNASGCCPQVGHEAALGQRPDAAIDMLGPQHLTGPWPMP